MYLIKAMEDIDDFTNVISECIKLLDENTDVLNNVDYLLQSEKEDEIVTNLSKNDLIDMAHEVSDSMKIKKAEYGFVRRLMEKKYD